MKPFLFLYDSLNLAISYNHYCSAKSVRKKMAIVAFFSSRATTVTTLFSLYVGYIENVRASLFHSSAHTEEMKEK